MLNHFKWTGCFFCLCQASSSAAGQGSRNTMFCTIRFTRVWPVSDLEDTKNRMEFSDICKRPTSAPWAGLPCCREASLLFTMLSRILCVWPHTHTKRQLQYQLIWNAYWVPVLPCFPSLLTLWPMVFSVETASPFPFQMNCHTWSSS